MKTTSNCLFIDTNIDMYVPFGKSVDDVTFRLSLRHLFCPQLKKTMEHNLNRPFWDTCTMDILGDRTQCLPAFSSIMAPKTIMVSL